jgi:hypothetical protein
MTVTNSPSFWRYRLQISRCQAQKHPTTGLNGCLISLRMGQSVLEGTTGEADHRFRESVVRRTFVAGRRQTGDETVLITASRLLLWRSAQRLG